MKQDRVGEAKYENVYGDTFSLYGRKDMDEFIRPLAIRFERNGLDAGNIFKGKRCLDAGCGNGRGTIFMLSHGASHVTGVDVSEKNIESASRFAKDYAFSDRVLFRNGSLEKLPFRDGEFDFVWCNGVIMHTAHPDVCLSEISRVLSPGGQMWLYIYGAGGVYWRIIFGLRKILRMSSVSTCIKWLRLLRYEPRYVAEFADDWYASFLRTYTNEDLSSRLASLGFSEPALLRQGADYDTSHRLTLFAGAESPDLMGEGDLRYLLTKTSRSPAPEPQLSEDEVGSRHEWSPQVVKSVDPHIFELEGLAAGRPWLAIAAAAKIQRELRLLLSEVRPISLEEISSMLSKVISETRDVALEFEP